jgi:hypothetical protein
MKSPIQILYDEIILKIIKIFDALKSPKGWLKYFLSYFRG